MLGCLNYATSIKWIGSKIKLTTICSALADFFDGGHFVHETRTGIGGFEYRYTDFRHETDYRTSYDDTLIIYFMYLHEQFNLTDVFEMCLEYFFELELYYLQKIKIFELLSEPTKLYIYRYCIKRNIAAQGRNLDKECEVALNNCVDTLTGG